VTSAPPSTMSATAVIAAPPTLVDLSKPSVPEPIPLSGPGTGQKSGWGKKVKPPSMVLDDDVNGFRGNTKRKGGGGKKNKKVCVTTLTFYHSQFFFGLEQEYTTIDGVGPFRTIRSKPSE
jgi:hypothetical protein